MRTDKNFWDHNICSITKVYKMIVWDKFVYYYVNLNYLVTKLVGQNIYDNIKLMENLDT